MPDKIPILKAQASAAIAAALVLLICAWPRRRRDSDSNESQPHSVRQSLGGVLSIAAAFAIGCYLLGIIPKWPPTESMDRMLLILLPTVAVVELVAALRVVPCLILWGSRIAVAAGAAPILLYGAIASQGWSSNQ